MESYFSTELRLSGTNEELTKAIIILKSFTEGDVFLSNITVCKGNEIISVDVLETTEDIEQSIKDMALPIIIKAEGPWGSFDELSQIDLLKELADMIPFAEFACHIDGESTYESQSMDCELKNQKMTIKYNYENLEDEDDYAEFVKSLLPYHSFIKRLHITEDYDEDSYEDFLDEAQERSKLLFDNYEDFLNYFEDSTLSEAEYLELQADIKDMGLNLEDFEDESYSKKTETYDPIEHIKIKKTAEKRFIETQSAVDAQSDYYYKGTIEEDTKALMIDKTVINSTVTEEKLKAAGLIEKIDIDDNNDEEDDSDDWGKELVINKPVLIWNEVWRVSVYFEDGRYVATFLSLGKKENEMFDFELIKTYAQNQFGMIHKTDNDEYRFGDEDNVSLRKTDFSWNLELYSYI